MDWPKKRIEPMNGWTFRGKLLIGPDGREYAPDDDLTMPQIAQLRGSARTTAHRVFGGKKSIGSFDVARAGEAVAQMKRGPKPKEKQA